MKQPQLRVFFGSDSDRQTAVLPSAADSQRVTVSLGDVLPLLADAVRNRRAWVRDFDDDEITISSDLYDVLMAYRFHFRPTG